MEKIVQKSNILGIFKVVLLSIVVVLIAWNFISQKENLTIDEFYTYGLANNSFQLDIEDFKEYKGMDLLLSYTAVKDGHEYDVHNVFFNQKLDTHPPIYYLLVNFICSINKNTFSMWYGLIINLIFLVAVFWEMRYLFTLVINDKISSSILTLISFFTFGFTNEIVFTRMYVLLTAISLAFTILIIDKLNHIDKKLDIAFLIKFYIICVLGILTQYHFMIMAFFFCIVFAISVIKKKDFKLLISTFVSGILSILTSYAIFPAMLRHLASEESLHSLTTSDNVSIFSNAIELLATIKKSFFGNGIFIYLIIFILLIAINILVSHKKKLSINIKDINRYYIYFLLCSIFYFIVISLTTKFSFERYLYNIYPFITIVLLSPIYFMLKNIYAPLKYMTVAVIFFLALASTLAKTPHNLCIADSLFEEYLYQLKSTKTIFLYHSIDENGEENTMAGTSKWKLPYPLYLFRHMDNITFVDTGHIEKLSKSESPTISGYDDIMLLIYTTQDDNKLINLVKEKNNVSKVEKIYFTSYIHVYRLSK